MCGSQSCFHTTVMTQRHVGVWGKLPCFDSCVNSEGPGDRGSGQEGHF